MSAKIYLGAVFGFLWLGATMLAPASPDMPPSLSATRMLLAELETTEDLDLRGVTVMEAGRMILASCGAGASARARARARARASAGEQLSLVADPSSILAEEVFLFIDAETSALTCFRLLASNLGAEINILPGQIAFISRPRDPETLEKLAEVLTLNELLFVEARASAPPTPEALNHARRVIQQAVIVEAHSGLEIAPMAYPAIALLLRTDAPRTLLSELLPSATAAGQTYLLAALAYLEEPAPASLDWDRPTAWRESRQQPIRVSPLRFVLETLPLNESLAKWLGDSDSTARPRPRPRPTLLDYE